MRMNKKIIYPNNLLLINDLCTLNLPKPIVKLILIYATIYFDFYIDKFNRKHFISTPHDIQWSQKYNVKNVFNTYFHSNIIFNFTSLFSGIHKLYFKINDICENPHDIACTFPRFRIKKADHIWTEPYLWGTSINSDKSPTCLYANHSIEGKWHSLNLKKNDVLLFLFNFNNKFCHIYKNNVKINVEYYWIPKKIILGIECLYDSKISFVKYEII